MSTLHNVGSKELISKYLIGNRFHVKPRILSPYSNSCICYYLLTLIVESTNL